MGSRRTVQAPSPLALPCRISLLLLVIPALTAVYDELLLRASAPPFEPLAQQFRHAFEARTGLVPPEHPSRSDRDAAAWEDALIAGGLALQIAATFEDPSERSLLHVFSRAHRGIFLPILEGKMACLHDLWGGGCFLLLPRDDIGRAFREIQGTPFAGRLVAGADGCAVLPGRVWLPEAALPLLPEIFKAARTRAMETDALVEAVLWMEHLLATMSRIKPQYAFRAEGLDHRIPGARK